MHLSTIDVNATLESSLAVDCWVGWSLTLPADDASSGVTEPVGGSYARVFLAGTSWTTADARQIQSAVDVAFPVATADQGTALAYVLFTAATAGRAKGAGRFQVAMTINTGAQAILPAGIIHAEAP
jgi:hypothetical protein